MAHWGRGDNDFQFPPKHFTIFVTGLQGPCHAWATGKIPLGEKSVLALRISFFSPEGFYFSLKQHKHVISFQPQVWKYRFGTCCLMCVHCQLLSLPFEERHSAPGTFTSPCLLRKLQPPKARLIGRKAEGLFWETFSPASHFMEASFSWFWKGCKVHFLLVLYAVGNRCYWLGRARAF